MKTRKHHNNKAYRRIKRGWTQLSLKKIARKLRVPYGKSKKQVMKPEKFISGGQTGADQAGLFAARTLGIETGGWIPKGWLVQTPEGKDISNPSLEEFGLKEHHSSRYSDRTKQNVLDADATVWFGYKDSAGGRLTIATAREHSKPYIINPTPEELRAFVKNLNVRVLNVAGNRISSYNPTIYETTYATLIEVFC